MGTDIYYANLQGVWRLDAAGVITSISALSRVSSLTPAGTQLYYADYLGGLIGRIDLQTHAADTIVTGLAGPLAVRYDPVTGRLYFLEGGTTGGQFKDGAFKAIQSDGDEMRLEHAEWWVDTTSGKRQEVKEVSDGLAHSFRNRS